MLKRTSFRTISLALILALVNVPMTYKANAQDSSRPSQSKQPQQQQNDPKDKKGAERQDKQVEEPAEASGDPIKIDTDLVSLDVTVNDPNNNPVFSLKKEDFSIYEDSVRQTVEHITRVEVPVSFGMVIDTSGSMGSKIDTVSQAASLLIRQMRHDDEGFVATFRTEPEMVQEFTSDRRELEDAVTDLGTKGGTALLDAIIATAGYAHQKGQRRRKALVVVSDGLDRDSAVREQEVMDAIKADEVQVYLVGFLNDDEGKSSYIKAATRNAKDLLTRIAEDSGGRAYFPKDVSEISKIAAQIAKDLRSQYVVSYYSTNDKRDGTFRNIQVAVDYVGGRKLVARARRGYYARNEKGQASVEPEK